MARSAARLFHGEGPERNQIVQPQMTTTTPEGDGNDEENDFIAFALKYQFQSHAFPWKALQAVGWTYRAKHPQYRAPKDEQFQYTAQDVTNYLDQWGALPDVFGTIDSLPDFRTPNATQQQRRYEVLQYIYHQQQRNDKKVSSSQKNKKRDTSTLCSTRKGKNRRSPTNNDSTSTASTSSNPADDENSPKHPVHQSTHAGAEQYFHRHKKPKQPSRTNPYHCVALAPVQEALQTIASPLLEDDSSPYPDYCSDFSTWRYYLTTHRNLLLFGTGGCKRKLVQRLAETELSIEGPTLLFNCRDCTLDDVLNLLVSQILKQRNDPEPLAALELDDHPDIPPVGITNPWNAPPLVERAIAVGRAVAYHALETTSEPVFLVLQHLGAWLDNSAASHQQEALAALYVNSRVPNGCTAIRIVATLDAVVDAYPTGTSTAHNLSWMWIEVHTGQPYDDAYAVKTTFKKNKSSTMTPAHAEWKKTRTTELLNSIAPRHAELLQLLARLILQQQQQDNHNPNIKEVGVTLAQLRNACEKNYIVARDSQVIPLLNELKDHQIVKVSQQPSTGDVFLQIPDPHTLKLIAAETKRGARNMKAS